MMVQGQLVGLGVLVIQEGICHGGIKFLFVGAHLLSGLDVVALHHIQRHIELNGVCLVAAAGQGVVSSSLATRTSKKPETARFQAFLFFPEIRRNCENPQKAHNFEKACESH